MTEILGALIILGAVLLLIARYIIQRRQRSDEEDEDLAASIEKLKKELQQSADTIIKRLGSHVTKLEGLLREADDRRVHLESRVAEAQRLEWALRQRIEELERRLRDLGQPLPAPPAAAAQVSSVEPVPQTPEARRTDGDEFAAVLHQSILREQARASVENAPVYAAPLTAPQRQIRQDMPQSASPHGVPVHPAAARPVSPVRQVVPAQLVIPPQPRVEEAQPVREDESIVKARALLRAGRTIEQVARETGVEIGALRLMKQMVQRD